MSPELENEIIPLIVIISVLFVCVFFLSLFFIFFPDVNPTIRPDKKKEGSSFFEPNPHASDCFEEYRLEKEKGDKASLIFKLKQGIFYMDLSVVYFDEEHKGRNVISYKIQIPKEKEACFFLIPLNELPKETAVYVHQVNQGPFRPFNLQSLSKLDLAAFSLFQGVGTGAISICALKLIYKFSIAYSVGCLSGLTSCQPPEPIYLEVIAGIVSFISLFATYSILKHHFAPYLYGRYIHD